MAEIVLCNLSDANNITEELKLEWTKKVLISLNISQETLNLSNSDINAFRAKMNEVGIEVITCTSGTVEVFKKKWLKDLEEWLPPTNKHLVAKWKPPTRVKRIDKKGYYYELHLNTWSVFKIKVGEDT